MERIAIILSGGGAAPRPDSLPPADLVVAADSGLHLADELGLEVDVIIGDLDSVEPSRLDDHVAAGARLEQHPEDKDATDLELAMAWAVDQGADRIVVAGGGAGRLDHLLGIATLLASSRWSAHAVEWHTTGSVARVVRSAVTLDGTAGDLISVISMSSTITVSIEGARWELDHATLASGSTRGLSNEMTGTTVHVTIHDGTAIVMHLAR